MCLLPCIFDADKLRHSKWLSMHEMKTKLNKPEPGQHITLHTLAHMYSYTHTLTKKTLCPLLPLPKQLCLNILAKIQVFIGLFFFSPYRLKQSYWQSNKGLPLWSCVHFISAWVPCGGLRLPAAIQRNSLLD